MKIVPFNYTKLILYLHINISEHFKYIYIYFLSNFK